MKTDALLSALERHFGFTEFRLGQEALIRSLLLGRSVLGVMPTGAGKSLCYQLPATLLDGVTLVVSPLIALMKDQVDALTARGISSTLINSTLTPNERAQRVADMVSGRYRLVYVAPERLMPAFLERLARVPIAAFIVDEAHCISQWGHDFRPEYRGLGAIARQLAAPRIGAFTATATPEVQADIIDQLGIDPGAAWVFGFERPNLRFDVVPVARSTDKRDRLLRYLRRQPDSAGIVYCATRRTTVAVATALAEAGIAAAPYHGGLEEQARADVQDRFMSGALRVVVATNAFGMGIDKRDVRFVVHHDLPASLEALYQEAGRAGRDGLPAETTILFDPADLRIHEALIERRAHESEATSDGRAVSGAAPDPELSLHREQARDRDRQRLAKVVDYCAGSTCRCAAILEHFGESFSRVPCGACDVCDGFSALSSGRSSRPRLPASAPGAVPPRPLSDGEAVIVQKALSAVARSSGALTSRLIAQALVGSKSEAVLASPLGGTTSHGLLPTFLPATLERLFDALADAGCLTAASPGSRQYALTTLGQDVMWRRKGVHLGIAPFGGDSRVVESSAAPDAALLAALRLRRAELAATLGVPAALLCPDATLRRIARLCPTTAADFARLPPVSGTRPEMLSEWFGPVTRSWADGRS